MEGGSAVGHLRRPLTRFVGRDVDVAEVEGILGASRLVTLVGPPGCGKSRLALEVVTRIGGAGTRVVDLATAIDPATVGRAVASALGVDWSAAATLVEAVADDDRLLVLDNCEHVAVEAAALADLLLAECPRLRVLATSRTPLGVPGEQCWPVPPLGLDHAVELLLDRIELVSRRPGSDVAVVRQVAERICRRLDGLPLAVELTAAWSRVLSLDEIATEIERPSLLALDTGPRGRHASMAEAIGWSHALLSPAQRRLFERLSVFAGGFDLQAAQAVAAVTDAARREGAPGPGHEHEAVHTTFTTQAPGMAKPDPTTDARTPAEPPGPWDNTGWTSYPPGPPGTGTATDAPGTADANPVDDARSPAETQAGAHTNWTTQPNSPSGASHPSGTAHNNPADDAHWPAETQAGADAGWAAGPIDAVGTGGVVGALSGLVDHSLVVVDGTAAGPARYRVLEPLRQFAEARLVAAGEADAARQAHAEHYLAVALASDRELRGPTGPAALRRLEREEPNLRAALSWARTQRSDVGLRLCTALTHFWTIVGRVNEGWRWTCSFLDRPTPDLRFRSSALARAGKLAWLQRDGDRAQVLLEESLALRRQLGDSLGAARRLRDLAPLAIARGDTDAAIAACEEAMAVFRWHADERGLGSTMLFLGWAWYFGGNAAAAEPWMRDAWAINQHVHHEAAASLNLAGLAFCAADRADTATARRLLADHVEAGQDLWATGWLWAAFGLAVAEDRARTALRLAGGAEASAQRTGMVLSPQLLTRQQPTLDRLRDEVGHARAERLLARGAQLTVEELMTEALAEPDAAGTSHEATTGATGQLSRREWQVAELLVQGLTNGQMAERLFISKRTVESHVDNMKHKLGVTSRRQVIAWLLSEGVGAAP